MTFIPDSVQWAEQHFGAAELGDARRTRRLVKTAARIAGHPEGTLPKKGLDWAHLKGLYRLADRPEATHKAVLAPHQRLTHTAMADEALVLILHDSTSLNLSTCQATTGLGPIGDGRGKGFVQHNSLAVVPDAGGPRVLGLSAQRLLVRRRRSGARQTHRQRLDRPRESALWLEGIAACGQAPEGCTWVDIGDCGIDIFDAMQQSRTLGHHFLFRVSQDRRAEAPKAADPARAADPALEAWVETHLRQYARTLPARLERTVTVAGHNGRPEREARVKLASAALRVLPPLEPREGRDREPVAGWVMRVWEPDAPVGVEPLEWFLWCSLPVQTLEELELRWQWYRLRPVVEDYHKVEKSGCGQEQLRLQSAARLEPVLALLAVLAVRVLQLRSLGRATPELPAEQAATEPELAVVGARSGLPVRTARQFVRAVAQLGGFLGRKGDGEPGVVTLWRGYSRLQDLVEGYQLRHRASSGNKPPGQGKESG